MRKRAMFRTACILCVGAAATTTGLGAPPPDSGSGDEMSALRAKISQMEKSQAAMQGELQQLRAKDGDNWLNERRTDEVKALVKEVLADADTRASLAGDGMMAGYDGKFFLASPNGDFRLNFSAQIQGRYIANLRRHGTAMPVPALSPDDGHEDGFQIRRVEPTFDGYIGDPKIDYLIILQSDRDSGTVTAKIAQIAHTFTDANLTVFGGRIYDTFARESIMSSKRAQTVDRSAVANIFPKNDDIVEGIGMTWKALPDYLIVSATFNDGLNSGTLGAPTTSIGGTGGHDFTNGAADWAVTGRVDAKLFGDWSQMADVESWSKAPDLQVFLGGGIHYESAKSGDSQAAGRFSVTGPTAGTDKYDDLFMWTGDALVKFQGFGFMGAFYGLHFRNSAIGAGAAPAAGAFANANLNCYAATAQAGYTIQDKLEPFVRYEWIGVDSRLGSNPLNLVTVGFNWFLKGHAAKFTLDTVVAFNNINNANTLNTSLTGIGLLPYDTRKKGQCVVRAQFQLLF
jgi:phosphate-selective porin OprO and OprP